MMSLDELQKVERDLTQRLKTGIGASINWAYPSLNIIDCVLSLNRQYEKAVRPRVEFFRKKHPDCNSVAELIHLIHSYKGNFEKFTLENLNLKHAERGRIINDVCKYLEQELSDIVGENEMDKLNNWANDVRPGDSYFVGVKGFGLSGFQYLRMLFGAQTAKPDVHIINYVSDIIGRKVTDIEALYILEKAAKKNNLPLRDLDFSIWQERSSKK
jgi:hypothetical protein